MSLFLAALVLVLVAVVSTGPMRDDKKVLESLLERASSQQDAESPMDSSLRALLDIAQAQQDTLPSAVYERAKNYTVESHVYDEGDDDHDFLSNFLREIAEIQQEPYEPSPRALEPSRNHTSLHHAPLSTLGLPYMVLRSQLYNLLSTVILGPSRRHALLL